MDAVLDQVIACLKSIRIKVMSWAVRRPILALTLVITISVLILPLVSAAALLPIVALMNIGEYLESKGILTVVYAVFCQGIILAILMVVLFFVAFAIVIVASVMHSYNFFDPVDKNK